MSATGGTQGAAPSGISGNALPILMAAREACPACPYYNVCPLAPVMLQAEARPGERRPHPHGRTLELFMARLRKASEFPERDLLAAMSGEDEGLALVSGCLLAVANQADPSKLRILLESINARAARSEKVRLLSTFEEHLQRAAALAQDPGVPSLLRGPFRLRRPDREVTAYEALRLIARLVAGESPALWWLEAVHEEDRPAFEASFVVRDRTPGEDSATGPGSIDCFFTARAGGRSAVFYYRRDSESRKQALVPAEGVRADSLLKRMFKVFDSDARKTHRLFAKLCRGLNNGYKTLDKKMLWEGLKSLEREHLVVLALYAPRLAKFVEKRAQFRGLYRLVKFLHMNVADDENGIPAHVKVFERRAQVGTILDMYGKESFLKLCRYLFGIAEAYRPGPGSADLIFKIGEVAYLLTAVQGFNPRGLEIALAGTNALAFTAYGLQPPLGKEGGALYRYKRLLAARERVLGLPAEGKADKGALLRAIDQGFAYMAVVHGYEDVAAFAKAVLSGGAGAGAGAALLGVSGSSRELPAAVTSPEPATAVLHKGPGLKPSARPGAKR